MVISELRGRVSGFFHVAWFRVSAAVAVLGLVGGVFVVNAALQMSLSPNVVPDPYSRVWFDNQLQDARTLGPVLQSRWRWNSTKKIAGYKGVSPELGQIAAANSELRISVESLRRLDLNLAASDQEICDWSKAKARQFEKWVHDRQAPIEKALVMLAPYGIEMPRVKDPKSSDAYHRQVLRLCSPEWWRRQVRTLCQRHCEKLLRSLGETRKSRGSYVSDYTLRRMMQNNSRNRAFLESSEAENDLGQVFSLAELSDLGISNPALRRGELMVRVRGFEDWVKGHPAQQWRGMFYTLTCPSKYHAWHKKGGSNKNFNGSSPLDGQRYLNQTWARIRAKLKRQGIPVFGFRVAEPHHDGTPHWHILLFVPRCRRKALTETMRHYAMQEDGGERGAKKYRFTAVTIDPRRGGAAGYIAKYISKNIDGFAVDVDDEAGTSAKLAAQRVRAWASVWGIRQFQQIGGPPVTVWREARRLAANPAQMPPEGQLDLLTEEIVDAADRGLWSVFTEKMGGAVCRRDRRPVSPFYIFTQELGRYSEQVKKLRGVLSRGFFFPLISRPRKWITRRIQSAKAWVQELVAASPPPLEYCQ